MSLAARVWCGIRFAALLAALPAQAQIVSTGAVPPDTKVLSPGGVDLRTGHYSPEITDLTIGSLDHGGLQHVRVPGSFQGFSSNWRYTLNKSPNPNGGNYFSIANKAIAKTFYSTDWVTYTEVSLALDGLSSLKRYGSGSSRYFIYTAPDGTTTRFETTADGTGARAVEIKRPDGLTWTFSYGSPAWRVTSNTGYVLIFTYHAAPNDDKIAKVCVLNAATTTPPVSHTCPAGAPSVSYTYLNGRVASVTDVSGALWTINNDYVDSLHPFTERFYKPGYASPYLTNTYALDGDVGLSMFVAEQTFVDGHSLTYDFSLVGHGEWPNLVLLGHGWTENGQTSTTVDWGTYQRTGDYTPAVTPGPIRISGPLGRHVDHEYNGAYTRLLSTTQPGGIATAFSYNANGSLTERRTQPVPGSGEADLAVSYTYDCTVAINCKQPATMTDARGNTTDYRYDPVHGGLLSVTGPAATAGAVRPEQRYSWGQFYAWYRNTAGTLVQAATPVWRLTEVSECRTQAACAGTADETRTTYTYGAPGTPNNLLPTQVTVAAGDGSVSATTAWTYNANGDRLSEDGPLAGTADTTRWRYDAARRVVGVIGPDPDGAGPRAYRATRNTYDAAGRLVRVERGTVLGSTDADWAAFIPLASVESGYDALDRRTLERQQAGGVTYAATQYSFDTFGRLECTAVRMNPAAFGALPASACLLGAEGTQGPDRITQYFYDSAGRRIRTQVAVGTAAAADEESRSYTVDDQLATLTDGEGNRTSYEYDGLGRLATTRYPVATPGALTSSATDYEQYGHDANGNTTSRRLRDGQWIYQGYDAQNRLTGKDLPAPEGDVGYAYDLQSHLLAATQGGVSVTQGWDALGRQKSESSDGRTTLLQYDAAGRLTRITHSDGYYASYVYNTSDLTAIQDSGGATLASFQHDDLGRRTGLGRMNGTGTGYGYDGISRLTSLTQDLTGSTHDATLAAIGYNPASQMVTLTRSNELYAWGGHYNQSRPYSANGLNQLTSAGPTTLGHDARGNLTQWGTASYGYSVENRLTSAPGGTGLAYDPLGRLAQVTQGATTTRFEYLGSHLIAERNASGTLLRRYVHGPGEDEPLVWYEGTGTADRRFLHADERGSIIAVSNSTGVPLALNTYDEYGVPGAGNQGRFQYTGQAWLAEAGLYHYKARVYSPTLGRFLQTDPTGYDDGPNLYAYAGNDPLDKTDPTGLQQFDANTCSRLGSTACSGNYASIKKTAAVTSSPQPALPTLPNSQNKIVITSGFGPREQPSPGASTNHNGIDLRNGLGGPVFSPQDGTVTIAGPKAKGGNTVVVSNDDGSRNGFAHTGPADGIVPGAKVTRGQQIGVSDGSGTTTAHTHMTYTPPGSTLTADPVTTQYRSQAAVFCSKGSPECP
jgi:RHS repeat-associated protein